MHRLQKKNILWSLVLIAIVGTTGYILDWQFEKRLATQQAAFDEKFTITQEQIASLYEAVHLLSGENTRVALSVKELQNRKDVIAKSQDELLTDAVAIVAPSVVSIVISKDVPKLEVSYDNPFGDDPFFKNFNIRVPVYRQKGTEVQKVGAGTGFLISRDGYVLTNRHVVADSAATYTALLSDGRQLPGRVVFRDSKNDLALLKIEGDSFKAAPLGNSASLKLGQTVIAIGNALGEYNNSVSIGIISGLDRDIEAGSGGSRVTLTGVIQTDAAINPGNSGGPLLNMNGEVIGVNVATVIGSSNISFSIPISTATSLISSYLAR